MTDTNKTHIGSSLDDFLAEQGHDVEAIKAAALKRVEDYRAHLLALADRAEAATGPDRELDSDIAAAIGWNGLTVNDWEEIKTGLSSEPGPCSLARCPAYTDSLDAAATVMPESIKRWQVRRDSKGFLCVANGDNGGVVAFEFAPTECAARVAVGLRARATIGVAS